MGLPIHRIANEFRDTWTEILQKELNGYAVTEVVTDPPRQCNGNGEFFEKEQTVYVVGNCGDFVLFTSPRIFTSHILVSKYPFFCTVKKDGQGMVNLEERINRAIDKMSFAFQPEEIKRYEKSLWTRFFRLFGWEHVGSLDFAHRKKVEIIEGEFESEPRDKTHHASYYFEIRCQDQFRETWQNVFQEHLQGITTTHVIAVPVRRIYSPNGRHFVETPMAIEFCNGKECYFVSGQAESSGYWICTSYHASEINKIRKQPLGKITHDILLKLQY